MNPSSSGFWNDPPPPGTEYEDPDTHSNKKEETMQIAIEDRLHTSEKTITPACSDKDIVSDRKQSRSSSKSREKERRKRHKSRSGSRDRRKRSRSRSRRRRRRYSSSRSRSRSYSPRHRRHKRHSRRYTRSRSRSHSHSRSRSHRYDRDRRPRSSKNKEKSSEEKRNQVGAYMGIEHRTIKEEDTRIEEEEEEDDDDEEEVAKVPFKNDGSFLEMFKKMQEEQQKASQEPQSEPPEVKKPALPMFGKRRGGKVLKTGMVQKVKTSEEDGASAQDAWSVYMKEVRKYKEACCDDDSKTRPLVK